jgi:hypothetical protein
VTCVPGPLMTIVPLAPGSGAFDTDTLSWITLNVALIDSAWFIVNVQVVLP